MNNILLHQVRHLTFQGLTCCLAIAKSDDAKLQVQSTLGYNENEPTTETVLCLDCEGHDLSIKLNRNGCH